MASSRGILVNSESMSKLPILGSCSKISVKRLKESLALYLKLLIKIPLILLFTKIPLNEAIEICTNGLFKSIDIALGLKKSEFKDFLTLATEVSDFIFNNILYKQIDGVAMGFSLRLSVANAFFCYQKLVG